jgi:cystathionine beta-lyase/cystathionine gamma-synthase
MQDSKALIYLKAVMENMPKDWLDLTTHRLDIYDEAQAKNQFLAQFEALYQNNNFSASRLYELPTAYDYIRLGHPLSCILEWTVAKLTGRKPEQVISFSSKITPILAILRKNLLDHKNTQIVYREKLPDCFDADILRRIYGYAFELKKEGEATEFDGTTVFLSEQDALNEFELHSPCDFQINIQGDLGSILIINGKNNNAYISEIQHVRRRETIAMTPNNTYTALRSLLGKPTTSTNINLYHEHKAAVLSAIASITNTDVKGFVGSSGLSIQYAIVMGLIHDAIEKHPEKAIKIIIPPNCYGGTNDQARRVAACNKNIEIMDLLVDSGKNMVLSIDEILDTIAREDAVPYIIAEIPTNPRVEVPDLSSLVSVLSKSRQTVTGSEASAPVFILDQTFCPNVHFLGNDDILAPVRTIAYVSGSKFPSGGKCTAGFCVANKKAAPLMEKIGLHLSLCDNEATALQYEILAKQLPSMNKRITEAYKNTRNFVSFIQENLPAAKINFVSETLANQGFKPSVFSLDLPTRGATDEEKEAHKRTLNLNLINLMISNIPEESKFCVSYGQLKGCYWTVPATSTQGTTKEGDKDYIVRVSVSPKLDLERHQNVFLDFIKQL